MAELREKIKNIIETGRITDWRNDPTGQLADQIMTLITKPDAGATVPCSDLLDMPLFSKRKAIADLCEKWCKQHHAPTHPQNIILAALEMNLLQIKEHV